LQAEEVPTGERRWWMRSKGRGDLDREPKQPDAEAVAISSGRVVGVGTTKEIMNLARKETSVRVPEEKLTVAEAVHGYKVQGAYASGEEQIKGSIEPGKLADLVILSDDILPTDPIDIQHAKVDMTTFDAKVIYERV
jgi:predicted amidohydrolase YtcJ